MKDLQFAKRVVFVSSLVPAVMLTIDFFDGDAGADRAFYLMRSTGLCAMIFLALSLAVTPLRRITGKNYWSIFRRMLGLYAFFYASLHFLTYLIGYQGGNPVGVYREMMKSKFVFFGLAALLMMVPLAATSTAWAVKRMGNKKWKRLHRLVYLCAISAAVHYLMQGKVLTLQPIVFAAVLVGLVADRPLAWGRNKWLPAPKPKRSMGSVVPMAPKGEG